MFPDSLDDAVVYFYTPKGSYGIVTYENKKIQCINYISICSYTNDTEYYLFYCNDKFEVIADYMFYTIEECRNMAEKYIKNIIWLKKLES